MNKSKIQDDINRKSEYNNDTLKIFFKLLIKTLLRFQFLLIGLINNKSRVLANSPSEVNLL